MNLEESIQWYREGERDVDFVRHLCDVLLAERDRLKADLVTVADDFATYVREAEAELAVAENRICELVSQRDEAEDEVKKLRSVAHQAVAILLQDGPPPFAVAVLRSCYEGAHREGA